ncbi:MAG: NTP transferase domain-containing protein [Candidatus Omnitrophica bacterium]|nr:NTP transferase domain-containing protein [Candidatus Omnitrophota bacterium]
MELLSTLYREWLQQENRLQTLETLSCDLQNASCDSLPEEPAGVEEMLHVMAALPKRPIPPRPENPVAVILAGGRGSRMGADVTQKCLCPIHGRPALLWAMDAYRNFGIEHFIVIVGVGYKEVIQCLGTGDPHITFLFQEEQLGTGHAARLAARYLNYCHFEGSVLVTMGDKFITRRGLQELMFNTALAQSDLILASASKKAWPDSGRIVIDENDRVRAVIERPDVVQRQLISDFYAWPADPVPGEEFRRYALHCWNRPQKLRKILNPGFWDALSGDGALSKQNARLPLDKSNLIFEISDALRLSPAEVEQRCDQVNISVYIFKAQAFYEAAERLRSNNAQGELYLTDAVYDLTSNHHADLYHVTAARMPDDYDVMGFNTLEELAEIERRVQDDQ